MDEEKRKALRLQRHKLRRKWVIMTLWRGMGHLLALPVSVVVFVLIMVGVAWAGITVAVLAGLRFALMTQIVLACMLNYFWWHRVEIRALRAKERGIRDRLRSARG